MKRGKQVTNNRGWFYTKRKYMGNEKPYEMYFFDAAMLLSYLCDNIDDVEDVDHTLIDDLMKRIQMMKNRLDEKKNKHSLKGMK